MKLAFDYIIAICMPLFITRSWDRHLIYNRLVTQETFIRCLVHSTEWRLYSQKICQFHLSLQTKKPGALLAGHPVIFHTKVGAFTYSLVTEDDPDFDPSVVVSLGVAASCFSFL